MCKVTNTGYIMADGTVITFEDSIENISPKHVKELSETNINAYEMLFLKKNFVELGKKIDGIRTALAVHNNSCPVNRSTIDVIIRDTVREELDDYNMIDLKDEAGKTVHTSRTDLMQDGFIAMNKFNSMVRDKQGFWDRLGKHWRIILALVGLIIGITTIIANILTIKGSV